MTADRLSPELLLCHLAIGRDVAAVREYVADHRYAGVEWGLDSWRVAVARGRRQRTLEEGSLRPDVSLPLGATPLEKLDLVDYKLEWAAQHRARILKQWGELFKK